MTNAWLRPGATVVPIDYATYCSAEVARDAALFLVDQREQFLANRDAGNFDGYPDPTRHASARRSSRGTPRPAGRVVVTHLGVGLADLVFADAIVRAAMAAGPRHYAAALRRARCVERCGSWAGWSGGWSSSSSSCSASPSWRVVVMAAITTQRGWPQTTGTIAVPGLHQPATVVRDRAGIIQITADDPHDLFLAQGYVHAQERMWQMEVSRRIGAGPPVGAVRQEPDRPRHVHPDTRLAGRGGARPRTRCPASSKAILQAYADGVNAWITEHDGRLSTPFVVAGLLSGTRRPRRHHARAVDAARHRDLAEGPGLVARRQRRRRDLPAPRRRPARRSGQDRRAVPAVRRRARRSSRPSGLVGSGGAGGPAAPRRRPRRSTSAAAVRCRSP